MARAARSALLIGLLSVISLLFVPVCEARTTPPEDIAPVPPRGWSSWTQFRLFPNETLIRTIADALVSTGLRDAGYSTIWLDDGWSACSDMDPESGRCHQPAPRDGEGRIVPCPTKFPSGMPSLTAYLSGMGVQLGIYTAVSARTCGGYWGSLGNEEVDMATFIVWNISAVKFDTCNTDCPVHTGCIQGSVQKMWDALDAGTDRPVLTFLDSGNPTSPQRVFNPRNFHVTDEEALLKLATNYTELVWMWAGFPSPTGRPRAHMFKSWFDREDSWRSMLDNAHNQVRVAEYVRPGTFHTPDYLTVGMGGMTMAQYTAELCLWAVLGAPLFLSNDVRSMDPSVKALITNEELLAINADPLCVQGSLTQAFDATEAWIRPLNDTSFAVAVLNKSPAGPQNVTLNFVSYSDFFPATFASAAVRDVLAGQDMGVATTNVTVEVGPQTARLLRITPQA